MAAEAQVNLIISFLSIETIFSTLYIQVEGDYQIVSDKLFEFTVSRPRETLADEWSPLRESTGLAGR